MREKREIYGYDALQAALEYRRRFGWSMIPVRPPVVGDRTSGKKPFRSWKQYTDVPMSEIEMKLAFGEDRDFNLALVCGRVSKVVAVDADSQEAVNWVRRHLPTTPLMTRTGGGGQHFFYKHPGVVVRPRAKLKGMALDLRGDDSFVVIPPSRSYTGRDYRWIFDPDEGSLEALPPFDPSWLAEPRRHAAGTTIEENDRMRLIRRAMAYVEKMDPAIAGQGGHNATMRVAGVLIQRFGLTMEEAMPIMLLYNARCDPQWNDKELMHKLSEAVRLKASRIVGGER